MQIEPAEMDIQGRIYTMRGTQVMLDRDLAELYEVKPIRLREQVRLPTAKAGDILIRFMLNDIS